MKYKKKPKVGSKADIARKARIEKAKALKEWSKIVREYDEYTCAVCGRTDRTQAHHILPKEVYPDLMYNPLVGICLCPFHHKFGSYSFHKNPLWGAEWLRTNRKDQYEWCVNRLFKENKDV